MKTVKREEPIIRNRFTDCPECKTRNFRVKKTVEVGRCRSCHQSYKIITVYMKTGTKPQTSTRPTGETGKPTPEPSLPSWQMPSDSSLFGTTTEQGTSTFSSPKFAWDTNERKDETETTSGQ